MISLFVRETGDAECRSSNVLSGLKAPSTDLVES
jgi:hypothetical protein